MNSNKLVPAAVSVLVVVGFLGLLGLLMAGVFKLTGDLGAAGLMIGIAFGVLCAKFSDVVSFWVGSSIGSRNKDDVLAKVIDAKPVAPVPAAPPTTVSIPTVDSSSFASWLQTNGADLIAKALSGKTQPVAPVAPVDKIPVPTVPPPAAAVVSTKTLAGKMSTFGGPNDHGVAADEGLALVEPGDLPKFPGIFLPEQPAGTSGLARRLDPSSYYLACRWDYHETPRAFLQAHQVQVTANGKSLMARPVDWGPNEKTVRVADLSPGLASALGLKTDDQVSILVPLPHPLAVPSTQPTGTEPAWMTAARAEIGFHEKPNNTGIQKYIDLAGFGSEGDPWCSIFAAAMLRKAGVPVTGVNAMARSFSTAPSFTKIDAWRKGAIAVFWRGSQSGGEGHVGFADSEDASHVQTLGGNESDQVMIESIPKNGSTMGLLGYWWPVASTPVREPKVD